jgi:hypothetical protein
LRRTEALSLLAALAALPAAGPALTGEQRAVPPARSGDIAIAEELAAARAAGSLTAYRLFIARHPRHALAGEARRELRKLEQNHGH